MRAAVRDATFELLEEVGYERLLLTDVAARAGVNKTTVYRRWATKVELVADLLTDLAALHAPTPDTGSLEDDLEILLSEVAAVLKVRAVTAVIRAAMMLAEKDEETQAARRRFWDDRFSRSTAIVERAIARGELPVDTDPRRFLELVFGALYLRLLVIGEDVDDADIRALAERSARRREP